MRLLENIVISYFIQFYIILRNDDNIYRIMCLKCFYCMNDFPLFHRNQDKKLNPWIANTNYAPN